MARLAIVDRREINVPFDFRKSCGVILAYNGELYDYHKLKAELSDGTPWETNCDSEVIARAWRAWGPKMLHRFNGMFGLALVDELKNEVFLARDRAGEKPLYYAPFGTGICFASEIKALPIVLEEIACPDADVLEFDCLESTPFRDVKRLGPGKYIHMTTDTASRPLPWWALRQDYVCDSMTWNEAVEETQETLIDAIRIRASTDVPFGVQVSGGLDSAIVQAVLKSSKCYTVTFPDDGIDNLPLARLAAGHEPVPISFGMNDLRLALPKIAYHLDTPATWTAVCQWFMNQKMSADGCVIALSGEGADELFGGYSRYRFLYHLERMRADPRLRDYSAVEKRLFGDDAKILARLLNRSPHDERSIEHSRDLVNRFRPIQSLCDAAMRIDFYTTMQVLLRMADTMAAAFSMENRSVFFDYRLLDLSERMPLRYKITDTESKSVLCEVARRLGVHPRIIDQTTKKGLFLPWDKWTGSQPWERSGFAAMMKDSWRTAFFPLAEAHDQAPLTG